MTHTPSRPRDTVVLLHCSASSARQWDALAERLQPTHDVHAIDLHGHGRSPAWAGEGPFSLHDDAALALPVLEAAGGGHLIGHSYGGAVALHLAAARPRLVRSVALYEPVLFELLGTHAPTSAGAREAIALGAQVSALAAAGDAAQAAAVFVDYWSGTGAWTALSAERRRAFAARMPTVARHFATLHQEPLPAGAPERLASMPLLCLHGTRTTAAARTLAALLRTLLPHGRHEVLEGLGHMGPVTDPARVNARLLRFLRVHVPQPHAPALAAA